MYNPSESCEWKAQNANWRQLAMTIHLYILTEKRKKATVKLILTRAHILTCFSTPCSHEVKHYVCIMFALCHFL